MLKLTEAVAADAPAIAALAEKIWRIHYPPIIGTAQTEYMLRKMYSMDGIGNDMRNGKHYAFIDDEDGRAGYISWSYPAHGELFIHKFYVDPGLQGKGIGKRVFHELLEINPGVKTIRLTVNRKNFKSINFYYRVGFVIEDVKDFDIGEGYFMNDFVMKWSRGK